VPHERGVERVREKKEARVPEEEVLAERDAPWPSGEELVVLERDREAVEIGRAAKAPKPEMREGAASAEEADLSFPGLEDPEAQRPRSAPQM